MRILWCAPILLCLCARADESADRLAIEKVLAVFNQPSERQAVLARDADLRSLRRLEDAQAWSEVSPLYFSRRAIRFVTPDVASVDARVSQYGTLELETRRAALILLRREPDGWKVVLVRVW